MPRRRTGQLIWRKSGWHGRFWATVDGEEIRVSQALGTTSKAAARRKLARLVAEGAPQPEAADREDTFAEAWPVIVESQRADGLKTWDSRTQRLRDYADPVIGHLPVSQVRVSHVKETLVACRDAGKSHQTLVHLRKDIGSIFKSLIEDELVQGNPAAGVSIPKAPTDERPRLVLTDDEFLRFLAFCETELARGWEGTIAELYTMACTSRTFGGMRNSDLHAWDWSHVDTDGWADAFIPRPKTKRSTGRSTVRHRIPDAYAPILVDWWERAGRPRFGPIFPVRKGPRAGESKKKSSYARVLRAYLWRAGVHRALPGFGEAVAHVERLRGHGADTTEAEAKARALDALQTDTADHRAVDFYSFRRAYNTALARAGVNAQTAMRLAGHRQMATHMRYMDAVTVLETPDAAIPRLGSGAAFSRKGRSEIQLESSGRRGARTHDIRLVRATPKRKEGENSGIADAGRGSGDAFLRASTPRCLNALPFRELPLETRRGLFRAASWAWLARGAACPATPC